jgi:Tfp pilus assembly protein FimT
MLVRFVTRLADYRGVHKGIRRPPAGKTLTELLVVIAIIATVLGLFVPAAFQVLKAANNLK